MGSGVKRQAGKGEMPCNAVAEQSVTAFFRCPSHPASPSVCAGHKKRLTAIELVMRRGMCLWFVVTARRADRCLP